ncbi:dynamin-binding protein-like [Saccostrea echinata]|uniref:dynamin-binding protein-like n=1 Tax=Saccostrea echinata TaxID=191078 RepID=UPI002A810071|nr:dynamin-binding protein-like [Saccostrea echinata]
MGVENLSGQYVRAVYPFETNHPREISLSKGDIIRVTSVIDDNWYCGQLRGKEGNFPSSFVEVLNLPAVEEGQILFGAIENFPAQQDGDLEFRKGAIIMGTHQIDANWWQGQLGSHKGIFPVTHVMELELPPSLKERSHSVHSTEPLFALALCDSVAQLDEELGFKTGDIITVTEILDSDWYYGELGRKKGMFLSSCVELIQDTSPGSGSIHHQPTKKSSSTIQKSFSLDQSYYSSVSDGQPSEVDDSQSGSSNVPNNQSQLTIPDQSAAYTSENTKSLDSSVSPYAMTLYKFEGQSDNELSFDANEIVYLIQHVDDQWTEGEIDGRIGLFPTCFVSIIVDCPYAFSGNEAINRTKINASEEERTRDYHEEQLKNDQEVKNKDLDINENQNCSTMKDRLNISDGSVDEVEQHESRDQYALVLFSFSAETDQDLTVTEGDTVKILEYLNTEWVRALNENSGKSGLVPTVFLDIIDDSPIQSPAADYRNHELKDKMSVIINDKEELSVEPQGLVTPPIDKVKTEIDDRNLSFSLVKPGVPISDHVTEHRENNIAQETSQQNIHRSNIKEKSGTQSINFTLEQKPVLPVKPQINPKPVMKPKPSLSPKPNLPNKMRLQPVKETEDGEASMAKSSSAQVLHSHDESNSTLQKSLSTNELSSSASDMKTESRRATFSFGDVDTSKSLNDLISGELSKAKNDVKTDDAKEKLGNKSAHPAKPILKRDQVSNKSSSSSNLIKTTDPKRHSVNFPIQDTTHQRMIANDDFHGKFSTGNSVFFVDPVPSKKSYPSMRKPPPIPQRSFEQSFQFDRTPSLKKDPPPRPNGPRLASAPPTVPLIPVKVTDPNHMNQNGQIPRTRPSRPAPSCPIPSRPAPTRPMPTRPAPTRPQMSSTKPAQQGPEEGLIVLEDTFKAEAHSVAVADLRKKIKDLEMDVENCEKSRTELERTRQGSEDNEEIKENIEFYTDNISGLNAELSELRKNLVELCPEEGDLEAQREAERKRKEEEERQWEEEKRRAEEMREKRREKRGKVIEELIQTEKDFQHSLGLCIETFLSPAAERHPEVDLSVLMGNIEDVADISQRLLSALEGAVQGKDFEEEVIGVCFVVLSEDMKTAFAPYCRNHDEVITLLEKYEESESIMGYINKMLDKLRQKTVVFDLGALLIKPVQRILKYPLLLNELFKATEDDHPDKKEILTAINAMTDVASAINEYKRRKDLVFKYKKVSDESFGDKLAKLSFHTIKKKGSRFKGRISTNLGLLLIKDDDFDKEELKFRQLEKMVKVFIRNTQIYMDHLQESVSCHECMVADLADFYDDRQSNAEMQKYQEAQENLDRKHLPLFQETVRDLVTSPLNRLMSLFEAPNKVIQKRFDKLLDYDSMQRKVTDGRMPEKALQPVKSDYEGLNAQLLDELPKLYSLSLHLLQDCIAAFVQAQREYINQRSLQLSDTLDLPSLLSSTDNLMENFNIGHVAVVDKMSCLSFIPKGFNPKVDALKQPDKKGKRPSLVEEMASSQAQSQKVYLQQKFPAEKLYRVLQNYTASDLMDLSLNAGDLVGVVQDKDPMGNKDRWFVDNGAAKGFIPSRLLQSYQSSDVTVSEEANQIYPNIPVPTSPLSPTVIGQRQRLTSTGSQGSTSSCAVNYQSSTSVDGGQLSSQRSPKQSTLISQKSLSKELDELLDEDMTPDLPTVEDSIKHECEEFYYAEYAFQSRAANEVSLFEGQVVTVYVKHDEQGNSEWWYVDADGVKGYVPSNYLQCLARALGYPVDLFKKNVNGAELVIEEHGLSLKEAYKMVDHRLLERALHRTCNLHSGDWNMNVVRKSLYFLSHSAITFEELYNIRVAYQAFEQFDMKGLLIDQEILLSSIKMCGRSIAPMKLMHRLKHMKVHFEDKTRIQLSEYLELILWCGTYKDYKPEDGTAPQGKDKDLYKLADFEQLLSHYDARLAKKLNDEYLKEEWDFGKENLGSKKMFKEPPIICAQERMDMARKQRKLYKHLKKEIGNSQNMVYRVKAGFVRDRPLTAPDLSMYQRSQKMKEKPEMTTKSAYDKITHRINSARSRSGGEDSPLCDTSDCPQYVRPPEKTVTPIVSEEEIQETQLKKDNLVFDIETVEKRHRLQMEQTLDYYIPGIIEKIAKKEAEEPHVVVEDKPSSPRRKTTSEETINHLAYPESHNNQCHSKACDARYRGWHEVQTKKGGHFILTSPTFENSYQGRLHKKLHLRTKVQAKKVTSEFAYRYTKSSEVKKRIQVSASRPNTAPAVMQNSVEVEEQEEISEEKDLYHTESILTVDTGYESCEDKSLPSSKASLTPSQAWGSEGDSIVSKSPIESHLPPEAENEEMFVTSRSTEDYDMIQLKPNERDQVSPTRKVQDTSERVSSVSLDSAKILVVPKKEKISIDSAPIPQMQHSKPKVVAVGGIGKISLLESISELKQWEEETEERKDLDSVRPESMPIPDLRGDPGHKKLPEGEEKSMEDNLNLLNHRLSADGGKDSKRNSKAINEMPALTIEEKIEREKQARIKKQKRLQGSNLEKMGVTVFSRKLSLKYTSAQHTTSTSSVDSSDPQNSQTNHNPHLQRKNQSKSGDNSVTTTPRSQRPSFGCKNHTVTANIITKEKSTRSHSNSSNTTEKDKNNKNSSLQQNYKKSVRNNVTSTTDFEKENFNVKDSKITTGQHAKKASDSSRGQNCGKGKYDRLLKRLEGSISDVFANKLAAAPPKVK